MASKQGVLDLSSPNFDVDAYLSKLLKEKTLDELVKEEELMVNNVRRLDSDVHQIVYENYNKFLTATNTVRKIENEFNQLDSEMTALSDSMSSISSLVSDLSSVLGGGGGRVASLSRSSRAVSGVQFIFDLPVILQQMLDEKRYAQLVNLHLLSQKSLTKYSDIESVQQVIKKTTSIVEAAERELEARVRASAESVEAAGEALALLSQLGTPGMQLQSALLDAAENTLKGDLAALPVQSVDVLELVDSCCSTFLPNLALCAQLFRSHFAEANDELLTRLSPLLSQLHALIRKALLSARAHDTALVVRALDRYYRKCSSVSQTLPELSNSEACLELVKAVSAREVELCREKVVSECSSAIQSQRESFLDGNSPQPAAVSSLLSAFLLQIKTALAHLLLFTASDVAFASCFQSSFAFLVHSSVLAGSSRDVASLCVRIACADSAQPSLSLLLALFTHQMAGRSGQLQVLCREQFALEEGGVGEEAEELAERWRAASHTLLANYAQQTALAIGDRWCNAMACSTAVGEPRAVSAWSARVREELRSTADTVATLCGEERRRAGGVESKKERRTASVAPMHDAADSLWSERVDMHTPIHFNKQSIMTSIIKRVLKSGVEGVRMKTLSAHGMQQMQVDVAFLGESLSAISGDAPLLTPLLDQLLSAALRRCLSPQLLHPNVVSPLVAAAQVPVPLPCPLLLPPFQADDGLQ